MAGQLKKPARQGLLAHVKSVPVSNSQLPPQWPEMVAWCSEVAAKAAGENSGMHDAHQLLAKG